MARVVVRYWAAARAAAGLAEEQLEGADLDVLLEGVAGAHDEQFAIVLARSSFLLDGQSVRRGTAVPLWDGAVLEVLPPFAGG